MTITDPRVQTLHAFTERPACPGCGHRVDRLQSSAPAGPARRGPVAAVPCGCWLTQPQARQVVKARELLQLPERIAAAANAVAVAGSVLAAWRRR